MSDEQGVYNLASSTHTPDVERDFSKKTKNKRDIMWKCKKNYVNERKGGKWKVN